MIEIIVQLIADFLEGNQEKEAERKRQIELAKARMRQRQQAAQQQRSQGPATQQPPVDEHTTWGDLNRRPAAPAYVQQILDIDEPGLPIPPERSQPRPAEKKVDLPLPGAKKKHHSHLAKMLQNKDDLRKAIILKEVIGPPKCKQGRMF